MKRFERLQQILNDSVAGTDIGAHGPFWRDLELEAFKTKKVFGIKLVIPGDAGASNLVLALRGAAPFGNDTGTPDAAFPRMPVGFDPVSEENIRFIEHWIQDGCPDDEWAPPAAGA